MTDIAALLSEAEWLTRLARSLASDAAEAADAVQETWLAAMRSPPDPDRPVRPWLRRVLVNALRMRHRGRSRREANEAVAEALVDSPRVPDQLLERARLERRLADLVLALDEPFRTTVLLRYREGLSAEAIAKQQGIPAGTVRRRLKTALDRLRRDLDDEAPARWRAVFAPLAAVPIPERTSLWGIVMAKATTKAGVAIVIGVLLLAVLALVWRDRATATGEEAVTTQAHGTTPRRAVREVLVPDPAQFAQPGLAARAVSGRVTFEGKPFAGAIVRLTHGETKAMIAEAVSGPDGAFVLGNHPATAYFVTASATDKAPASARVDLRSPKELALELRLTACVRLSGAVQDGSGAPIAQARIATRDVPWPFAESDARGHYEICIEFGTPGMEYSATGYGGAVVGLDPGTTKRDVVLIPEATIAGIVVGEDGKPVAGAWITIDPRTKGAHLDAPTHGRSDTDGSFRIAQVAAGRNHISAFTPGRLARKLEVVVVAGQVMEGVVVRLEDAAQVTGTVVAAGVPVIGAGIGLSIGNFNERGFIAVTQADGSFTIDRVPRTEVALFVEDHTVIAPRSVRVDRSAVNVRLDVDVLGGARGRVVHAGTPISGARVGCGNRYISSGLDGTFACTGIPEGPRTIEASTASGRWGMKQVVIERGKTTSLELELEYGAAICGTVVDEAGQPMRALDVRAVDATSGDSASDRTGTDGRFCTRFLTGGTYQVSVSDGGQRVEPVAPISPVSIDKEGRPEIRIAVVTPRLAISGTVTDSNGAPVPDAIIHVDPANRIGSQVVDMRAPRSTAITDAAGTFTLARLPAGEYSVLASGRDGSATAVTPVRAGARDLVVILNPAGRIDGTLVGFTSEPAITGINISTAQTDNPFDAQVDGGRFSASGLSPGTYVLMAVTSGGEGDTQEVVVRPGQTTTVTMTSRGTTSIVGKALEYRTRVPVAGLRCSAATRNGDKVGVVYNRPDSATISDATGRFTLDPVSAGEIVVSCLGGAPHRGALRSFTATRGQPLVVEVFSVRVTGESGTIDARLDFMRNHVDQLTRGGMAERAGLAVGDEVLAVDGVSVAELDGKSTMAVIVQRRAGSPAMLAIRRGTATRTIAVTVRADDR